MGRIKDSTGSYTGGLLSLSAAGIVAMVIVLALGHDTALERQHRRATRLRPNDRACPRRIGKVPEEEAKIMQEEVEWHRPPNLFAQRLF